jgi:hypothetical protein
MTGKQDISQGSAERDSGGAGIDLIISLDTLIRSAFRHGIRHKE